MSDALSREKIVNGAALLPEETVRDLLGALDGWVLTEDGKAIECQLTTKTFLKAQALAALAGGIGELANHHPDLSYGWGYCRIRFSTHSAGGVTMNDLICASRLNSVL
ncbi:4a-hydroxytetrahydrobiopterin dehydratase [Paracoccus aminophilus]|nr:4a-hydroxytetrahydrobiopterin dehydratase [Paracoccus aminophilus]